MKKLKNRFKIWLFRQLFSEVEKCILNQALNCYADVIKKDCLCDYKEDLQAIDNLNEMSKNNLWN